MLLHARAASSEARNDPKNRLLSSAAFNDRHSTIEHGGHSHGHHTGVRWIDLILAGSAIFISVVSLIVSIHHGRTMEHLVAANEKQVKASTLPILRYGTGNVYENQNMVSFT